MYTLYSEGQENVSFQYHISQENDFSSAMLHYCFVVNRKSKTGTGNMRKLIRNGVIGLLVLCTGCGPAMTGNERLLFTTMVASNVASGATSTGNQSMSINIGAIGVLWGLGEIFPERREIFYGFGTVVGIAGVANNSRSTATSPSGYDR